VPIENIKIGASRNDVDHSNISYNKPLPPSMEDLSRYFNALPKRGRLTNSQKAGLLAFGGFLTTAFNSKSVSLMDTESPSLENQVAISLGALCCLTALFVASLAASMRPHKNKSAGNRKSGEPWRDNSRRDNSRTDINQSPYKPVRHRVYTNQKNRTIKVKREEFGDPYFANQLSAELGGETDGDSYHNRTVKIYIPEDVDFGDAVKYAQQQAALQTREEHYNEVHGSGW